MGFFKDFKDDFSQAVGELFPGDDFSDVDSIQVNTLDNELDVEQELSKLDGLLEQVERKSARGEAKRAPVPVPEEKPKPEIKQEPEIRTEQKNEKKEPEERHGQTGKPETKTEAKPEAKKAHIPEDVPEPELAPLVFDEQEAAGLFSIKPEPEVKAETEEKLQEQQKAPVSEPQEQQEVQIQKPEKAVETQKPEKTVETQTQKPEKAVEIQTQKPEKTADAKTQKPAEQLTEPQKHPLMQTQRSREQPGMAAKPEDKPVTPAHTQKKAPAGPSLKPLEKPKPPEPAIAAARPQAGLSAQRPQRKPSAMPQLQPLPALERPETVNKTVAGKSNVQQRVQANRSVNIKEEKSMDTTVTATETPVMETAAESAAAVSEPLAPPVEVTDEVSLITAGTNIRGNMETTGSFEIEGRIEGDIKCNGKLTVIGSVVGNSASSEFFADAAHIEGEVVSSGTVKIGLGSVIIGNISATSAVIAGAVKGDIDVQGPVVVDTSAVIMGNIKSRSVQINNGAVIEGFCSQCYSDVDVESLFDKK